MNPASLAQRDPIFARISRAVPRSVDPMLREDVLSDIYLAIREGVLHPRDVEAAARKFIGAAFAAWANRWGNLSLDVAASAVGNGPTFADLIEDEHALAAFDRVVFHKEERAND